MNGKVAGPAAAAAAMEPSKKLDFLR